MSLPGVESARWTRLGMWRARATSKLTKLDERSDGRFGGPKMMPKRCEKHIMMTLSLPLSLSNVLGELV